jgi:UDP-glucose 4-epimerase
MSRILITGGTGYIGSHTCVELIRAGLDVVIIDDLSNSELHVLDNIKAITGVKPEFYQADLTDHRILSDILQKQKPLSAVIHFAARKSVGESVQKPSLYYHTNILSLLNVLDAMKKFSIPSLVFSSSSTVYGEPDSLPVRETMPFKPAQSPYGNTKQIGEAMIRDLANADPSLRFISLRYFNPIGADESGLIGELPKGTPGNLVPFITQTVAGLRPELQIFGDDYSTPDGTAIRDYIHVTDLAKAHVAALNRLLNNETRHNYEFFNVGTGKGYSVFEIIDCFEAVNKILIPFRITGRRAGDVECIYADTSLAHTELNWKAEKNLEDMMRSAWKWQINLMKNNFTTKE